MVDFKNFLSSNSDALVQLGAGLLSGKTASEQLGGGLSGFAQGRKQTKAQNATLNWLQQNDPELGQLMASGAISPTDAFKMAYEKRLQAQKPMKPLEINGKLVDPIDYHVIADFSTPAAAPETWDTVSPEEVKTMNLPAGSYQRSRKTGKLQQIGGGLTLNPPAGYTFADPSNPAAGVNAMPGGPAEKLAAEVAGRVGLADEFQRNLPSIKEQVKNGDVTGPIDVGSGMIGRNAAYRQIQTGVEALQRMMTGAGMNELEAKTAAAKYLPTLWDDPDSLASKLDQLNSEIEAAKTRIMAGRGLNNTAPAPSGALDPLGIRE